MKDPVNLTNLHEMTGGDAAMEEQLFRTFMEDARAFLSGLQASIDGNSTESWRRAAHAFKGASLNLGAAHLGDLCKKAQDNHGAPADQKAQMLHSIRDELDRVREYLKQGNT